jgi:hypothetical protein
MQHFGALGGTEKSKTQQGAESGEDINITKSQARQPQSTVPISDLELQLVADVDFQGPIQGGEEQTSSAQRGACFPIDKKQRKPRDQKHNNCTVH